MAFINLKIESFLLNRKMKKLTKATKNIIDKRTARKTGKVVVSEMKDRISKGTSPISGGGRFKKYKDAKVYPGNRKGKRPVNLELSGHMLKGLKSDTELEFTGGYSTDIFYDNRGKDKNGSTAAEKESGHREGVNNQPKRPSLPSEPGEKFRRDITNKIRAIYSDRVLKLIKKVNNA